MREKLINWLLDGGPAVRWQVYRDLLKEKRYKTEQQRVASAGWGKRLLSYQDENGLWANSYYSPKWTSTHYTLLLLRRLGLPPGHPGAQQACRVLLEKGLCDNGGISYWKSYPGGETCVTGMSLNMFAYFLMPEEYLLKLYGHLLENQMPDGGWNCDYPHKATHASFHTTLSVLEGLRQLGLRMPGKKPELQKIVQKAHEFLLSHRLYKSHRTGKVADEKMTRFIFPAGWFYQVYLALDYFRKIDYVYDERLKDAVDLISEKQQNGQWRVNRYGSGRVWFHLERTNVPSRIITLYCLRILDWWHRIAKNQPFNTASSCSANC